MVAADYLRRILDSRVYDVAIETPLDPAPQLSGRLGHRVLIKREDLQASFSFKIRGAYNKMAHLPAESLRKGVIASSAGNHAQGVAIAANKLGCRAVIVMPVTAPALKVEAVRALGAEVILAGDSYTDAFDRAMLEAEARHLTFVHPFDDPDVIAGQGTIGMEIVRQHNQPIDAIFVAIGGGGLIAGIAAYVTQIRPSTRIIGVQHAESTAMAQSLAHKAPLALDTVGLFSDGTAVRLVGDETFRLVSELVDEVITVDTDETCAAIKDAFVDTRAVLEPAGALALAGLKKYAASLEEANHRNGTLEASEQTLIAVACGANINFDRLRFVAERAELGEAREAVFAVTIPERPGSFLRFCGVVGQRSITEFNYRMGAGAEAHVFVGIATSGVEERADLLAAFEEADLEAIDLSDDEFAKNHLRHLVGGRSPAAFDERLYRFEFAERPGALLGFLTAMNPSWNISLFHYRSHGADTARVLVGIQVPQNDDAAFHEFVESLGLRYWNETDNPGYRLFLT